MKWSNLFILTSLILFSQIGAAYNYLLGTQTVKWKGGSMCWSYDPTNQPAGLTTDQILSSLDSATKAWESVCGISFSYQGLAGSSSCSNVVGWANLGSSGEGGITSGSFSSRGYFTWIRITLDFNVLAGIDILTMAAAHEFGHALGLGHSDVYPSVMYPIANTATPQSDDIAGCRSLYGSGGGRTKGGKK